MGLLKKIEDYASDDDIAGTELEPMRIEEDDSHPSNSEDEDTDHYSASAVLWASIALAFTMVCGAVFFTYYYNSPTNYTLDPEISVQAYTNRGTTGDFYGGMLNPWFSLASFVLLFASLWLQRKELSATRAELVATKKIHLLNNRVSHLKETLNVFEVNLNRITLEKYGRTLKGFIALDQYNQEILEEWKKQISPQDIHRLFSSFSTILKVGYNHQEREFRDQFFDLFYVNFPNQVTQSLFEFFRKAETIQFTQIFHSRQRSASQCVFSLGTAFNFGLERYLSLTNVDVDIFWKHLETCINDYGALN